MAGQGQIGDNPVLKVLRAISKELDKAIKIAGHISATTTTTTTT